AVSGGKDLHLAPGVGTGQVVNTGNMSLNGGDSLDLEIGGTATSAFDNFKIVGSVTLGTAALGFATLNTSVVAPIGATAGDQLTLIDNDGSDAVNGTFVGLPAGQVITLAGQKFQLGYQSGTGSNDVVLTALSDTDPVLEGTLGDDNWLVERDAINTHDV